MKLLVDINQHYKKGYEKVRDRAFSQPDDHV